MNNFICYSFLFYFGLLIYLVLESPLFVLAPNPIQYVSSITYGDKYFTSVEVLLVLLVFTSVESVAIVVVLISVDNYFAGVD